MFALRQNLRGLLIPFSSGGRLSQSVLTVTTPTVPGYRIKKVLGVVHGLTVRTRGMWGKWLASVKSMFGGKVGAYVSELKKAKDEALNLLKEEAARLGANAGS
ncbi:hypothetical protein B6U66_03135 [Candidatus Bathyarchaeota archaeon ex4484_135]|nr:MAG: hypothetical protein B6U66_03135 [Candidatus Bathyarchaeota archaeon ex4484_135]